MNQLLGMYILIAIFGLVVAIMTLPTLISRRIDEKNAQKIQELETLLKQKQQTA
jgi:hypothetical protein